MGRHESTIAAQTIQQNAFAMLAEAEPAEAEWLASDERSITPASSYPQKTTPGA